MCYLFKLFKEVADSSWRLWSINRDTLILVSFFKWILNHNVWLDVLLLFLGPWPSDFFLLHTLCGFKYRVSRWKYKNVELTVIDKQAQERLWQSETHRLWSLCVHEKLMDMAHIVSIDNNVDDNTDQHIQVMLMPFSRTYFSHCLLAVACIWYGEYFCAFQTHHQFHIWEFK